MVTYPVYFLEGYREVSHETKQRGIESVCFEKDGEYYTMEVSLKYGKRNGIAKIIGSDGTTMETVIYNNGHLNGICKHHYGNGKTRMKCMVVNDRMEG